MVQEALAYAFTEEFEVFMQSFGRRKPKNATEIYNLMVKRLDSQGKIATLKEVRDAIETAWLNGVKVADVLMDARHPVLVTVQPIQLP